MTAEAIWEARKLKVLPSKPWSVWAWLVGMWRAA